MKVTIHSTRDAHRGYLHLQLHRLQYERFDGQMSREVLLEMIQRNDAVAVLLYDPGTDMLATIRQFRLGPYLNDGDGWSLEIVAGLVDGKDDDYEAAAHREVREETGITLTRLTPVTRFFPSPGAATECVHLYLGLFDSAQVTPRCGGLDQEDEDIEITLHPFDAVWAQLQEGRVNNATAMVGLQWLFLNRARLREEAGEV